MGAVFEKINKEEKMTMLTDIIFYILCLMAILNTVFKPSSDSEKIKLYKEKIVQELMIELYKEKIESQEKMIANREKKIEIQEKLIANFEKKFENLENLIKDAQQLKEDDLNYFCETFVKDLPISSEQMLELCAFWKF